MNTLACRKEKYLIVFILFVYFYAATLAVIAQESFNKISDFKVKLSLSNLPLITGSSNSTGEAKEKNISTTEYSYAKQAGVTVSSEKNDSLLVSYLSNDKSYIVKRFEQRFDEFEKVLNEEYAKSIAYSVLPPSIQKISKETALNEWDKSVRQRYRNSYVRTVAPGVKHIQQTRYTKSGSVRVNIVEVYQKVNNKVSIEAGLASSTLSHKDRIINISRRNNAVAGINASFFKPSNGVPLGTLIANEELITGPIYNRVTLGIKDNEFVMARIKLLGKVTTDDGQEIAVDNINQPRMLSSYTLLYSYRWGKYAPPIPQYGIQVAIADGKVVKISKQQLEIPASGVVIVGPEKKLAALKVGQNANISFTTDPNWQGVKQAVSGGPYLVKNGQVFVDIQEQKFGSITGINPRTAVGYTKDNKFIMVTIDGRQKGSVGTTLYDLAKIMKEYGCYNAMNLDGGSSTQMVVNNRIVNSPTVSGGAYVSNGLIVKLNK